MLEDRTPSVSESTSSPHSLSYATCDADGGVDWHPEVEELLDEGAKFKSIVKLFASRRDAGLYWAKSMRRRFEMKATGSPCVECYAEGVYQLAAQWKVHVSRLFLGMPFVRMKFTGFPTHHSLCATCATRLAYRFVRLRRLNLLMRIASSLMVLGFILGLCFYGSPIVRSVQPYLLIVLVLFGAFVMLLTCIYRSTFFHSLPTEVNRIRAQGAGQLVRVDFVTYQVLPTVEGKADSRPSG